MLTAERVALGFVEAERQRRANVPGADVDTHPFNTTGSPLSLLGAGGAEDDCACADKPAPSTAATMNDSSDFIMRSR